MDDPHKYGKRKSNNEEQNKVSRKTFPRYIAVASLKFKFQDFFISPENVSVNEIFETFIFR